MSKPKKDSESLPNPIPQWIREYRFLTVVVALTLVLAVIELNSSDSAVSKDVIKPDWVLNHKHNLPDVFSDLYPERSGTHYWNGLQAAACFDRDFTRKVCEKFDKQDDQAIRKQFEQSLASDSKSNEDLLRSYVQVLVQMEASQDDIDDAVRNWRKNFPHSKYPVPQSNDESKTLDPKTTKPGYR